MDGPGLNKNQDDVSGSQVTTVSANKEEEPRVVQKDAVPEARKVEQKHEVPVEVEAWVEKKEHGEEVNLAEPVVHGGEVLVEPANPANVKVELPLTEGETEEGKKRSWKDSIRWLAELCFRVFRAKPEKVAYKKVS